MTEIPRVARDDASHSVSIMEKGEHHQGWCSPFFVNKTSDGSVIPRSGATRDLYTLTNHDASVIPRSGATRDLYTLTNHDGSVIPRSGATRDLNKKLTPLAMTQ